ncbi:methionine--tRNA ligase [Rhizobium sp. MHM7A]|uniref:methionine--tRNA ligase n=1 Tax=Rhizobium sp. MHM7A TaxID=2583233 RepID=UPI00110736C0|nr:methionine--tRNA ligase [Rhizobium sp. MHM7A]TLX17080.1 methionine--tRNA ligase [Rhizobium sp. MHM7A]
MNNTLYLTTTIPYVNAEPHVGFALELVQADVIARWRKAEGYKVRLQTGSDENSLKNVLAAERDGRPTAEFVGENAKRFEALQEALGIGADDFIRTSSDPRHEPAVRKLWHACQASGDLYQKTYSGLYCNGCEQFYTEADLIEGCCPEHGTKPETVRETNWFFRLSKYEDVLEKAIVSDALKIVPETKRNEVLSLIRSGLEDFSVSRSSERARGWGIPVPDDASQTIYVWFDALGNYVSALGYGTDEKQFEEYWINAGSREHVVGKGVTRFHAVYWPAILLSAGLPLPTRIHVHGYLTVDGQKIGKSNGNAISPVPLVEKYGRDAVRYYLLRHIRATEDGDFSVDRLEQAYSAELAGGVGNLAQRLLSIIAKNGIRVRPFQAPADEKSVQLTRNAVSDALEEGAFHIALAEIFGLIAYANKAVADTAPWALVKEAVNDPGDTTKADIAAETLGRLIGLVQAVATLTRPFLPDSAGTLLTWIENVANGEELAITPLFPKII